MTKETAKKIFSFVFIFIFFCKMLISVMPLIAGSFDSKAVNAVIMQLEIEHDSEKDVSEKIKEASLKGEWFSSFGEFNFTAPSRFLYSRYFLFDDKAVQPFYPTVPTPPPSV